MACTLDTLGKTVAVCADIRFQDMQQQGIKVELFLQDDSKDIAASAVQSLTSLTSTTKT